MPPPVVSTARLDVRLWRAEEAPRLLDLLSREEVVKWLDDGPPRLMRTLEEATTAIERYAAHSTQPPLGMWAIEVRATGQVAGTVMLVPLHNREHDEVEIGWHLHPDCWGHGYASEAAAAVLAHGLAGGLRVVYALPTLDNHPSQAVARRIGMEDLGRVDQWYDEPSHAFRVTPEHPPAPPRQP